MKVPENKKIFLGARRWVAGQELPPYVKINLNEKPEKEKSKDRKIFEDVKA